MERDVWMREYKRLTTAFGKKPNAEQAAVFFDSLRHFAASCVAEAVGQVIREAKYFPTPADVSEKARAVRTSAALPIATCDVCANSTWTTHHCAGVSAPDGRTKPAPVDRGQYCGRDWVHADHVYVRRCRQCWVLGRKGEAA